MARKKRPPRASEDDVRRILRLIIDLMGLSSNATKTLALVWGVADGRRWSWEQAVEEFRFSPEQEEAVEAEIVAKFLLFREGVAQGHFKELVLRALQKKS